MDMHFSLISTMSRELGREIQSPHVYLLVSQTTAAYHPSRAKFSRQRHA
jgi:hypothetical protein